MTVKKPRSTGVLPNLKMCEGDEVLVRYAGRY